MMSAMNAAVPHDPAAMAGTAPGRVHGEAPQIGTWQWDIGSGVFSVAPLWCAALGLNPCEGPDTLECWTRRILPDDVGEFRRRFEAARLGKGDRFDLEYRALVGETAWIWLL